MSWGLGWKRLSEIFHLALDYGESDDNAEDPSSTSYPPPPPSSSKLGFRIDLDWSSVDDEDQVALRLQSQLMVALPPPQDTVVLDLHQDNEGWIKVDMKVVKRREPLRSVKMAKVLNSGQQTDGSGVLTRLIRSDLPVPGSEEGSSGLTDHWKSLKVLDLCGCGLSL